MELLTKEQREQLIKNGSSDQRGKDHIPVVKLVFRRARVKILVTEINPKKPHIGYGLWETDNGTEFSDIDFRYLAQMEGDYKQKALLDDNFKGRYPISVYISAGETYGKIIEDDRRLKKFVH